MERIDQSGEPCNMRWPVEAVTGGECGFPQQVSLTGCERLNTAEGDLDRGSSRSAALRLRCNADVILSKCLDAIDYVAQPLVSFHDR